MLTALRSAIIFCLLAFAGCADSALSRSAAPEVGPADLYFLAIGAGNSADEDLGGLQAASNSARVVANALMEAGARYGVLLSSEPGGTQRISRDDVLDALAKLKRKVRRDGARAPRLLVYIVSHGFGEPVSNYLFLLPDDLRVMESPISQDYVFRTAKRSIWSLDLLFSLMTFRAGERYSKFDRFAYSSLFSDKLGLESFSENLAGQERLSQMLEELDRADRISGDNAAIPFALALDNCNNGFKPDRIESNFIMTGLVALMYGPTLHHGRAFFAAKSGDIATTKLLPYRLAREDDYVREEGTARLPVVGPMAIHIVNVLRSRGDGEPLSLSEFTSRLGASGRDGSDGFPPPPFIPQALLRSSVGAAEFIPAKGSPDGELEVVEPTGGRVRLCCERID